MRNKSMTGKSLTYTNPPYQSNLESMFTEPKKCPVWTRSHFYSPRDCAHYILYVQGKEEIGKMSLHFSGDLIPKKNVV